MNMAKHPHHGIDYVEIYVVDMDAAKRFYGEAFGWTFNDYGPGYAGIKKLNADTEAGGLCRADAVTPGGPLVVLFSNDLDATVDAVKAAGGGIVEEPYDFPGGRRFHFRDPSGNELAVWALPR